MKKKWLFISVFCITMIAAVGLRRPLKVYAQSAALGFLVQNQEVSVGEVISIYLTIEADANIGDFEGYISYDPDYMEFLTGASCIAGGDGILKISDIYSSSSGTTRKYLMKFTALKPGSCEISVMNQPKVFEYETTLTMSVSMTSAVLEISAAAEASDNNLLASLKISPGSLTPTFRSDIYAYTAIVSKDTGSIYVGAVAEDEASRVTVTGNETLYTGENPVHIFVTAETGNIQEYLITVIREDANAPTPTPTATPTPTPEPLPEEIEFEWKLEAENTEGNIYLGGNFRYRVCELPETLTVPTGYQKTKLMISGITITAYAPPSGNDGDFVILVLQREEGEIALYRYDRAEKTIQRFLTEDIVITRIEGSDGSAQNAELAAEYEKNVNTMGLIIAALMAVWLLTAIGLIYLYMKSKGMRDDID